MWIHRVLLLMPSVIRPIGGICGSITKDLCMTGGPYGPAQDLIDDPYPTSPHLTTQNGRRLYGDVLDNRKGPEADFKIAAITNNHLVVSIKGAIYRRFPSFREFANEGIRIDWEQKITFYRDNPQIDFHLETHHVAGQWYATANRLFY